MYIPSRARVVATLADGAPVVLRHELDAHEPGRLYGHLGDWLQGLDLGQLTHMAMASLILTKTYPEPMGPAHYVRVHPEDRERVRWVLSGSLHLPFIDRPGDFTNHLSVVMLHRGDGRWEIDDAWYGEVPQPLPSVLLSDSMAYQSAVDFWRTHARQAGPEVLEVGVADTTGCPYAWHCAPKEPPAPQ